MSLALRLAFFHGASLRSVQPVCNLSTANEPT
jgi:hypothetical protein